MSKLAVSQWSGTSTSNTDIGGVSLVEGVTMPSSVNNIIREMMAEIARLYADLGAQSTVGGTGSAITIATSGTPFTAYTTGMIVVFIASAGNAGATTVNVNSGSTLAVRKISGGTDIALAANDMLAGKYYTLIYSASANSAAGGWILINPEISAGSAVTTFSDTAFAVQGAADATKQIKLSASGITTGTTRTWTAQDASGTVGFIDVANQVVTGGAKVTSNSVGTVSSGTTTLNPGTRPVYDLTNGGAFALAPSADNGTVAAKITNNASAGAITTSAYTKVTGAFDTTNGHIFFAVSTVIGGTSLLQIQNMF